MSDDSEFTQITRRWMETFTARSMHDWMRYVKTSGLSMAQFAILMNLRYRHPCGMSDLSERMGITPAAASQLVDKLVQSGLVNAAKTLMTGVPSCWRFRTKGACDRDGNGGALAWVNQIGGRPDARRT